MTSKDGKVLPQCAAQIAVLETTGKQIQDAFSEMRQEFKENNKSTQKLHIIVSNLTTSVDALSGSVKELNRNLDTRIENAVTKKQKECVLFNVVTEKSKKEITKLFKDSVPPRPKEEDRDQDFVLKKIKGLPKKVQAAIYIGMIVATIAGSIIGYFKFVLNG
jgi:predicted  nucleic acid-binding Zn-ribbon protein